MSRYLLLPCHLLLLAAAIDKSNEGQSFDAVECDPTDGSSSCEPASAQSWLQRGKGKHTVNLEQEPGAMPGRPHPGRVFWDGSVVFDVEKEEVTDMPAEIHYKLTRDQFGEMNDTHVFVPFEGMKTAVFARALRGVGSFEYGYAKLNWQRNPEARMWGKSFVVGALEKLHTLEHEGTWSEESLLRAREAQEGRTDSDEMIAQVSRNTLHTAVSAWALLSQGREKLVNASIDPRVFRDPGSGAASEAFDARMGELGAKLKRTHMAYVQGLGGVLPANSHASIDNFHLTAAPGLQVTEKGFWWPLGQKIGSIRGQVAFEPLERFDMMAGNAVLKFNEEDQGFDIFMGAVTHSIIADPSASPGATTHMAKIFSSLVIVVTDGIPINPRNDGRFPSPPLRPGVARVVREFRKVAAVMPPDYSYLFEPAEDLCTPNDLERIEAMISGIDFMLIANGVAPKADTLRAASVMALVADCATDFLRGDIDMSHAYGPFEAMALEHALSEFGSLPLLRGWNEVPEGIFCPPSGCAAAAP